MGEHQFQAEVGRVLSLVINSLYSNKEIFLRELVSNASDALDKLRFRSITEPALLEGDSSLVIRLKADRERGVLVIEDTGVGMTEAELVENLGTVARSGSQAFVQKLEEAQKKDVSIIGQFGVGFYSAYLVADRVEVVSRAAGTDKAWRWSSSGKDTFDVEPAERASRGTSIELHLKEDQKNLLDEWALRDLVRRYSDYLAYPIELESVKDGEIKRETLNKASALWQRSKSEITDEQYDDLYRHLTHDFEAPLARTHFRVEGTLDVVGLLWVPKHPPFDLDDPRRRHGVQLFVKRVLVMDDCDAVLPQWLRFMRGVVDSEDLPLNVSRELLQESNTLKTIKKQVTKRVVDLLDEVAKDKPEDYKTLWNAFGRILKEGLVVDADWKDRLAKLTRWPSTGGEEPISLEAYVSGMKEGQEAIYYVTGESRDALAGSPYLEALRARGYDVLLMTDAVDTWAAEAIAEFDGKKLVNAMSANVALPKTEEETKKTEEAAKDLAPLLDVAKKALEGKVLDVRLSSRLTDSPACLVLATGAMPAHLEKVLRQSGKDVSRGKRELELNPTHPVVQKLAETAKASPSDARLSDWLVVLYEQSLLAEGSPLEDPNGFARRLTSLLSQAVAAT
ncbi:Chaperone protein HtpG [Labilithrix luteola]|uniref:Chaperone protein HtpG n=1 Tax=Labilithrix luteola TaxID=1391654 RepID=A0A0K1Q223_9BACT|nr:molecular chaperone HtpG [Labilithrix luteola]AKU99424.1 Chaperone protein HtpG [Labilithrix luteola]